MEGALSHLLRDAVAHLDVVRLVAADEALRNCKMRLFKQNQGGSINWPKLKLCHYLCFKAAAVVKEENQELKSQKNSLCTLFEVGGTYFIKAA